MHSPVQSDAQLYGQRFEGAAKLSSTFKYLQSLKEVDQGLCSIPLKNVIGGDLALDPDVALFA